MQTKRSTPDENSSQENPEKGMRIDAQENRKQILQAASKVFSTRGLSVPISEIAKEAGVGVGTIYRHFKTKEILFDEINLRFKQKLTEQARSLISHTNPGEALFDFISHIMEYAMTNKAIRDAFQFGKFRVRAAKSGVLYDFQTACSNLLFRAQEAKAVREDIDFMDLFALLSGLLIAIDESEEVYGRDRYNLLLSIVYRGLRT